MSGSLQSTIPIIHRLRATQQSTTDWGWFMIVDPCRSPIFICQPKTYFTIFHAALDGHSD